MIAYRRLNKAVYTLNDKLGIELMQDVSVSPLRDVHDVRLSDDWYFSVDYAEVTKNSDVGLVNLLRNRLMYTLECMHASVQDLGIYVHTCCGTQPWVLIQGL